MNNHNATELFNITDEDLNDFFDFDLFYDESIEQTSINPPFPPLTWQPNSILFQDDILGTHQPSSPVALLEATLSQGTEELAFSLGPKDKGVASSHNGYFPDYLSILELPKPSPTLDPELRSFPKRAIFSSEVRQKVRDWLDIHEDNPYPSKEEKENLANLLQLSVEQISTLFNNERRRYKKGISIVHYL